VVDCIGLSDVGLARASNEDAYAVEPELGLFLVADGMGGAQAGERASAIAVETIVQRIRQAGAARTPESLVEAIQLANRNVLEQAAAYPEYEGMGTTVVAVLLDPPSGHVASVGDSRLYLYREAQLERVTSDQTWVNEVGRRLGLTEEQIQVHPFRNVLTMAVGAREKIEVRQYKLELRPGDLLLLCSDGLHGVIEEQGLAEVLADGANLQERVEVLIRRAREAGGPDNITAVLVEIPTGASV
jgi:serine/threonine protein phosphatase PrpC